MTCGCNPPSEQQCDPCAPALLTQESVASWLNNLTLALFGTVTKTIENGRAVWSQPCSPEIAALTVDPIAVGQGTLCYILQLFQHIGIFNGGIWNAGTTYANNTFVTDPTLSFAYVSLQSVPAGTPLSNTAYWLKVISSGPGPAGPAGPQGPPGPSGSGSTPTSPARILTSAGTITNADGALAFESLAPITQPIPQISALTSGKWFDFWTDGANVVTLTPFAGDTIEGNASYAMVAAGESFRLQSVSGNTKWRIY